MKLIVLKNFMGALLFAGVMHNTLSMGDQKPNVAITKELIKNYMLSFKREDSNSMVSVWDSLVTNKQQERIIIKLNTQLIGTWQTLRKYEIKNTMPLYAQKIFLILQAAAPKSCDSLFEVDDYSCVDTQLGRVYISYVKKYQWVMTCYTRIEHEEFLRLITEIQHDKQ